MNWTELGLAPEELVPCGQVPPGLHAQGGRRHEKCEGFGTPCGKPGAHLYAQKAAVIELHRYTESDYDDLQARLTQTEERLREAEAVASEVLSQFEDYASGRGLRGNWEFEKWWNRLTPKED